jgi:hypothetical protein
MGLPQALSETRAIPAEVPTKLVGNLSHSLCWKAFPQPLSEGYTIHNLAICSSRHIFTGIALNIPVPSDVFSRQKTAFMEL